MDRPGIFLFPCLLLVAAAYFLIWGTEGHYPTRAALAAAVGMGGMVIYVLRRRPS
jgi:hypothetical protein